MSLYIVLGTIKLVFLKGLNKRFTLLVICIFCYSFAQWLLHSNIERGLAYIAIPSLGFLSFLVLHYTKFSIRPLYLFFWISLTATIVFACINVFFIWYTPSPWVAIAVLMGDNVENYSHLYNRILMPFGTPPQLGFVLICLSLTLFSKFGNSHLKDLGLLTLIALITFLIIKTGSNSSFVTIGILLILEFFVILYYKPEKFLIIILIVLGAASMIICMVLWGFDIESKLYSRSAANTIESTSRHLLLRAQTIEAFFSGSAWTFLFGVGAGMSPSYIGGSYSFTVLLTVLLEQGLIGFIIYTLYFATLFTLSKSKYALYVAIATFVVSLFYQLNNDLSFYILPIMCIKYIQSRTDSENCY